MRPNNRENNQPRKIKITRNYTKHAEGSVLVEFGDTKVLCLQQWKMLYHVS